MTGRISYKMGGKVMIIPMKNEEQLAGSACH
jgi:hypothetical protein